MLRGQTMWLHIAGENLFLGTKYINDSFTHKISMGLLCLGKAFRDFFKWRMNLY